jgi:hypothetical protein
MEGTGAQAARGGTSAGPLGFRPRILLWTQLPGRFHHRAGRWQYLLDPGCLCSPRPHPFLTCHLPYEKKVSLPALQRGTSAMSREGASERPQLGLSFPPGFIGHKLGTMHPVVPILLRGQDKGSDREDGGHRAVARERKALGLGGRSSEGEGWV